MSPTPARARRRAPLIALAAALGTLIPAASATAEPMVVLYDLAATVREVATGPGALDAERFNLIQQQPVTRVLAPSRQAWKVLHGPPSGATPGLAGRTAEDMAALLTDRIRRSGGHTVFIDEAGEGLLASPADAANLATALDLLAARTLPSTGTDTLDRRVHVYVQGAAGLVVDPETWDPIWRVLVRAGGVWWQTYTPERSWNEAEWSTWAPLVRRMFAERGGDPARLRWFLRSDPATTMAEQLARARRGEACTTLANGLGAWRLGVDAAAFRDGYRAFVDGTAPCLAAPAPDEARRDALAGVMAMEYGVRVPEGDLRVGVQGSGRLPAGSLPRGVPARVRLSLGADPFGLAGRLGVDPAAFWAGAGAEVDIRGGGVEHRFPLPAGGGIERFLVPSEPGAVVVSLRIPIQAVRDAMGGAGADILGWLDAEGQVRTPAMRRRLVADPAGIVLVIPLRNAVGSTLLRTAAPPPPAPARVRLTVPRTLAGGRPLPSRLRRIVVTLRDRAGAPVARHGVRLALPTGRVFERRTGRDGTVSLLVPRRGGVHRVTVPGTRLRAARTIGSPPGPPRPPRARDGRGAVSRPGTPA